MARNPPQSKSAGSQAPAQNPYDVSRKEFAELSRAVRRLQSFDNLVNAVGNGFQTLSEELRAGRPNRPTPLTPKDKAVLTALNIALARPDWTETNRLPKEQPDFAYIGQVVRKSRQRTQIITKGP